MWSYNLSLALRSLKERPALTVLMILAMAIGLGMYVTFHTMAVNGAELPHGSKATQLHMLRLDNRETSEDPADHAILLPDTTYQDARNLLAADMPATRQTMVMRTSGTISVEDPNIRPIQTSAAATTQAFFSMFDAPFLYGNPWDSAADGLGTAVIVINKSINDRLFGGVNSVGKLVKVENQPLKVVGVLDDWHLSWRIYDRSYQIGYPNDYFVPVQYAFNQNLPRDARYQCWSTEGNGYRFRTQGLQELQGSECGWLAYWAEFPASEKQAYITKLNAYVSDQKKYGRFPRDNVQVDMLNIKSQMDYLKANFSGDSRVLMAQLFFAVCLLNAVGILLAKFVRRSKEVSIRRALGARQSAIVSQHVMEVIIMGLIAGIIGVLIAWLGLKGMVQIRLYATDYRARVEDIVPYFQLDWWLVLQAFAISIASALVVSIYPIWRLARQPAASLLRSQ